MTKKSSDAYKSISEVAELLNLINQKTGNLSSVPPPLQIPG